MSQFHLIAPSGYCINQSAAQRGVSRLEDAGHQVVHQQVIARRDRRFAGDENARLADINSLVTLAGKNRIVMPVRGGYGASRLLDNIDWQGLANRQKHDPLLICGHSDFTAIQMGLLAHGNVITFSGPMLAGNFGAESPEPFTETHFWQALTHPEYCIEWAGDGPNCDTQGTLWGGNLAMMTSLIGTPWLPDIRDGILVLEDINEHPFRVERMLLQLLYAGILPRQRALVLGSFSGATPNDYDAGYDLNAMYDYLRSRLSIPVITGLDFGHEPCTVTLALGAHAQLTHSLGRSTLTVSGHPVLTE
ncbi:TPA: muramoyltetrapeptide carboxypeptidase [Kluyvera ascorbata]|uniref:Muramoyltetrapeptide carboxypeptidase n=1 Tax=Kluyvera genomosp. 2 TaxID=2774054 RepID=A0A2T2Y0N8_9ENTR|nr:MULTISPECIES: muramoyltetrapeptide carboxypeptidase [Enterobacteriaceae]HAT3918999.1 muramoyltetrapeptide carboxypeptidase [Kluyvera ascorbata]PSR46086.1 muramoyltetrapeptide carboxypeptidase [Kluyvera genomosp. 2]BBQ83532.1 muramoyltetrapeptide carboxypeptidase [Klebsiella sp. WP3-W18-ESBL-02]BBR20555.1 muramoyltetrapeptide carboxypeptidase [Klebsiella sp. WP3-S18-ESBL-05]HAT3943912.1 muramoyltetrapeptide carboxypeptidase [Kluyvera ascorbata]